MNKTFLMNHLVGHTGGVSINENWIAEEERSITPEELEPLRLKAIEIWTEESLIPKAWLSKEVFTLKTAEMMEIRYE